MDHLFIWFYRLDLSQCYFPKVCWYANDAKSLIGPLLRPLCSLLPQASVRNVIVNGEDLCEVTLLWYVKLYLFQHGLKLVFRNTQYATMWLPLHAQFSRGIAPWQCCFFLYYNNCELVLIDSAQWLVFESW